MKIKNILICFSVIIVFIAILSCLENTVSAEDVDVGTIINEMADVKTPLQVNTNEAGIAKVINMIIGLLQIAGSGISVLVVTILGIKYIIASVEEKAEIKKQAIPIVIGCVLLFGAVNLMAALQDFTNTTFETTTTP